MLKQGNQANGLTSFSFTKKLQNIFKMSWEQLLSYEQVVCGEERSWNFKRWFNLLKANNYTDEEVLEMAIKRLRKAVALRENVEDERIFSS